jgi:hypothetical protein
MKAVLFVLVFSACIGSAQEVGESEAGCQTLNKKNSRPMVAGGWWRLDNDRPHHERQPAVGQERLARLNGRVERQARRIVMALSGEGQLIALVDAQSKR